MLLALVAPTGCSQYIDPNAPEPIRSFIEPEFSSEYLLYRPSQYNRIYHWPLVVLTHSAFPDSPNQRMRSWTQLAESHGFLVVAPQLESPRTGWLTDEETAQKRLIHDERRILSVVQHVRAGHNVSEDRIFLHGYHDGAIAALLAGTNHPGLFRAIAVSQPSFRAEPLKNAGDVLDHDQPILVHYDLSDALTGRDAAQCVDWLRSRGANLTDDPHAAMIKADTERVVDFFREIIRSHPWIRVRALPVGGQNPLAIRFRIRTSLSPTRYEWDFGDGGSAASSEPVHTYKQPGTYRVLVHVEDANRTRHRRAVTLKVPEAVVSHVRVPEDE